MNILCVGRKFGVHIEDPVQPFKPLCGKIVDPYFITRVKTTEDYFYVRCPKCRKIWRETQDVE